MKKVTYLNCTIKIYCSIMNKNSFFELKFISRFQSPSIASVTCCFYSHVNKVGGDYYSFGPLCLFQFQPQQTMIFSSFSPQQNKIQHLSIDPKKVKHIYNSGRCLEVWRFEMNNNILCHDYNYDYFAITFSYLSLWHHHIFLYVNY